MKMPNKYKKLLEPIFVEDYIKLDKPSDLLKLGCGKGADLKWRYEYSKKEYSKLRERLVSALKECDFIFKYYFLPCMCEEGYGWMDFNYDMLPTHNRRRIERRNKDSRYKLIPDRRTSKRRIYNLGFCGYKVTCPGCKSSSLLELPFNNDQTNCIYAFIKNGYCIGNGLRIMINDSEGGRFFINEFKEHIKEKLIYKGHLEWDSTYFDKYGSGHRYFESNYKVR